MKRVVLVAALALAGGASSIAAPQDPPKAVALLDQYDRGDFDGVVSVFATVENVNALRRQLEDKGEAWTRAQGPAAEPRRRLVAATMALEFANARLEDEWLNVDSLVEWGCRLLRQGPPTEAERTWQLASIALVEGSLDDDVLFGHVRHAESRFPSEPRFPFVHKFAVRVLTETASRPTLQPPAAEPLDLISRVPESGRETLVDQSVRSLTNIPADAVVAAEAALRAGYLEHIRSHWEPALASLAKAVERSRDPYITHLGHFMMGRTLERMDQLDRAEQAYGRALEAVPHAQSAVLVRAALLVRAGRAAEALSLAMASFEATTRPPDPWRLLPYGDYRDFAGHIATLRGEVGRTAGDSRLLPALVAWSPAVALARQRPTFRARTDSVSVNVSIKNRNVPVTGLTAADFRVLDNGVAQTVEQVAIEGVPIDLSLFLDTSTSFNGQVEGLRDDIQEIVKLLRPDDRLRVLVFGREVETAVGWSRAGPIPSFASYLPTRISPVYDGIAAALLHQPGPNRRHLVIAMTDGADYNGAVSSERVLDISAGVEGVLHLMIRASMGGKWFPARPKQPILRGPDQLGDGRLDQAAERTGGRVHAPVFGGNVVRMFQEVFDDFRTSYVLRYTPTGVKPDGWHELEVEVPSAPKATIRARRGYIGG